MKNERLLPYTRRRDVGVDRRPTQQDDPYRVARKPPEPTRCPDCKASFAQGRWTWEKAPADSYEQVCPACQRIQDRFPAGYVTIKGEFFAGHRDEIVALISNHEKKDGNVEITTTDSQLARGIGEALHEAYKGDLKLKYSRDENLLRATWKR